MPAGPARAVVARQTRFAKQSKAKPAPQAKHSQLHRQMQDQAAIIGTTFDGAAISRPAIHISSAAASMGRQKR